MPLLARYTVTSYCSRTCVVVYLFVQGGELGSGEIKGTYNGAKAAQQRLTHRLNERFTSSRFSLLSALILPNLACGSCPSLYGDQKAFRSSLSEHMKPRLLFRQLAEGGNPN